MKKNLLATMFLILAGSGLCSAATYDFSWLNSRITDGAVIDLQGDTVKWNDLGSYKTGLSINNVSVTIKNGVIDGADSVRIFNITATGTLTLEDITLQNGYFAPTSGGDNYNGGAILNRGVLNITNSIVQDNRLHYAGTVNQGLHGGAISNMGTLAIDSCLFLNNMMYVSSSPASARAGAIYNVKGNMTINNSSFLNNSIANDSSGVNSAGAVYVYGGTVEINNSVFENNGGQGYRTNGGAMYINSSESYPATVNITSTVFKNNFAGGSGANGGALYIIREYANVNIEYCVFSGNYAGNSSKSVYFYSYTNPGPTNVSTNFWGANNSNDFGMAGNKTMDNYFTVKLNIDSPNNTLSVNDPLLYHIDIALSDSSSFDLEKLELLAVKVMNYGTSTPIDSVIAQDYMNSGSLSTTLTSDKFTLGLYYAGNLIDTATYINASTGILDTETEDLNIYIHPNPVQNEFSLNGLNGTALINIYTLSGSLIKTATVNDTETITVDFARGIYFIKIKTAEGKETTRKLIVK